MKETLQHLRRLQAADLQINSLKSEISGLPKKLEEIDTRRQSARAQVTELEEALQGLEHERRDKEGDLQTENERLTKYKTQLYQIKTNKEYTAMLHEIETAEKRIADHEEKILMAMEDADTARDKLEKAKESSAGAQRVCDEEEKALRERIAEAERELAAAESERKEAADGMDAGTLKRYEQIRSRMRGIAVVEARKGICQGCQVQLTPQLYNELFKADALNVCPSCQRILFIDPEAAEGGA